MFDRDSNYNPGGDYYGEDQNQKTFKDSLGDALGILGGGVSGASAYAGNAGNAGKEAAKKIIPLIIIGVIVLIVIIGIFWIISQKQDITITITGMDSGPLKTAAISISPIEDNAKSIYAKKGVSTHNLTLDHGKYTITVSDVEGEFSSEKKILDVHAEMEKTIDIVLERDIDAKLTIDFNEETIYSDQKLIGSVLIKNNSEDTLLTGELITKDNSIKVEFDNKEFSIYANGAKMFDFTITGEKVTKETNASSIISIKGTSIKDEIKILALPTVPVKDVGISPATYRNESLEAGTTNSTTKIVLKNNNNVIPLKDIIITIIPVSTSAGNDEKLSWFTFSQADPSTPYKLVINSIDPKASTDQYILSITPPITAEVGDTFDGILKIESNSMDSEKTFPMIYKVSKKKETKTQFTQNSSLKIECNEQLGCAQKNNVTIGSIKNSGNQDISQVDISIDILSENAEPECAWYNLKINQISNFLKGESKDLIADFNPGTTEKTSVFCKVNWTYIDPTNNERVNQNATMTIPVIKR